MLWDVAHSSMGVHPRREYAKGSIIKVRAKQFMVRSLSFLAPTQNTELS